MFLREKYYHKLTTDTQSYFLIFIAIFDEIVLNDQVFCEIIEDVEPDLFDYEPEQLLEKKLMDAELKKPLLLTIEEELLLYSIMHIVLAYTYNKKFIDYLEEAFDNKIINDTIEEDIETTKRYFHFLNRYMKEI